MMDWISPTSRNISNRTLGCMPKETFSQGGKRGTEGPVSQVMPAARRVTVCWKVFTTPNSAACGREGTAHTPHVPCPTLRVLINVNVDLYQKVSLHLGWREKLTYL